jgi:ribosomal protein S18 acetylase RimI-like enzyme
MFNKHKALYSLRGAVRSDLEFLFKCSTEAMKPTVEKLNPDIVFDYETEFAKYTNKFNHTEIQVIQYDGFDVGRLRVVRSKESIYVGGIQILPEFQGKGIGGAIFNELIQESDETKIPIILEVHDINTRAIDFYKKLGFVKVDKEKEKTVLKYSPA